MSAALRIEELPAILVVGVDVNGRTYGDDGGLSHATSILAPPRIAELYEGAGGPRWASRVRRWPTPFADGLSEVEHRRANGERVAILATGDPMWHGVGGALSRRLGAHAVRVVPAPGAHALTAARMGWPLEDVGCHSLHGGGTSGRALATLAQWVAPGRRLIALTSDGTTAASVAGWLVERGFGASRLTVHERLGATDERVRTARADDFDVERIDPLNTLAIECVAARDADWHSLTSGLPDDAFAHDGQMTKEEVRALTVARLRPRPGGVLWDIGAGCGSVGIEWLRLSPAGRVVAIEPRAERREMIARNAEAFGLRIEIVAGSAPGALDRLPAPDCAFIGGGASVDGVFDAVWGSLRPGGTIGANAVTLEGEAMLAQWHAAHGGRLTRLAVQRAEAVGPFRGWRAAMPVTMWSVMR